MLIPKAGNVSALPTIASKDGCHALVVSLKCGTISLGRETAPGILIGKPDEVFAKKVTDVIANTRPVVSHRTTFRSDGCLNEIEYGRRCVTA